ncbi:MAG: glycerophosphodiester phosphodiesterase family protein, partial [Flavisolibacter sp.]
MSTSIDWQGHRGARGLMPENTIPAMLKAIDLDVTTLELDVVVSKDQQVVVSHDVFFHHNITTTPSGKTLSKQEAEKLL